MDKADGSRLSDFVFAFRLPRQPGAKPRDLSNGGKGTETEDHILRPGQTEGEPQGSLGVFPIYHMAKQSPAFPDEDPGGKAPGRAGSKSN